MGIYLGMQKNIMQYFSGVININLENITYDNLSLVHISEIKLFALKWENDSVRIFFSETPAL